MKAALLGVGKMGRNVVRHLLESPHPVEITFHDPHPATREAIAREFGITPQPLEAILTDCDLVFITSSNATHEALALAALEAGKAVLCEKPMATTLEGAHRMVSLAEARGLFLQIGFEARYSHLYTRIKAWIDSGVLGEIRHIHCTYVCSEFWGRDSWRVRLDTGGSMFGEKLCHYVDLPRWWIDRPIEEIYAAASPNIVPYFEVCDNYQATTRFEGGAVSQLTFLMPFASNHGGDPLTETLARQREEGYELSFRLLGTRGGVQSDVFHRFLKRWEYHEDEKGFQSRLVETIRWQPEEDHGYFHNTRDQTHDIVRRVTLGLPPATSARDALETLRLCHAADLSVEQRRPIAFMQEPALL